MDRKIKVGVYGATGYTGFELLKLLLGHPYVSLEFITSETYQGKKFSQVFPCAIDKELVASDKADPAGVEAVFTCLPHTTAMQTIARIDRPDLKIIDLSADFRFEDPAVYQQWYGTPHSAPQLLGASCYGLPELFRSRIVSSRIVGNPGCYTTSVILPAAPLVAGNLLEPGSEIIADSKSGVTGAGRKADLAYNFCEVDENILPYKVGRQHRHVGEMESVLGALAGDNSLRVVFTPQLAPWSRGILSNLYLRTEAPADRVRAALENAYRNEPFVRVLPEGQAAHLNWVRGNNLCVIGVHPVPGTRTVVVSSAIDNLIKGASGQALQNFNLVFGLEESTGLAIPSVRA